MKIASSLHEEKEKNDSNSESKEKEQQKDPKNDKADTQKEKKDRKKSNNKTKKCMVFHDRHTEINSHALVTRPSVGPQDFLCTKFS